MSCHMPQLSLLKAPSLDSIKDCPKKKQHNRGGGVFFFQCFSMITIRYPQKYFSFTAASLSTKIRMFRTMLGFCKMIEIQDIFMQGLPNHTKYGDQIM